MRINTGAWKDQSGADESQVALTKKKKKNPALPCQEKSPVKTEVRFQPMNPREIMYHENMAWEREKQQKSRYGNETGIRARQSKAGLETGWAGLVGRWTGSPG